MIQLIINKISLFECPKEYRRKWEPNTMLHKMVYIRHGDLTLFHTLHDDLRALTRERSSRERKQRLEERKQLPFLCQPAKSYIVPLEFRLHIEHFLPFFIHSEHWVWSWVSGTHKCLFDHSSPPHLFPVLLLLQLTY